MLSGYELIIALFMVWLGATVMGSVGFGMGLVVSPVLLLLVEPQMVVVVVNAEIGLLTMLVLARNWRHVNLKAALWMSIGGVAAAPIGVLLLGSASPGTLRIAVSMVVLALAGLMVFDIQLPGVRRRFAGPVFGFLSSLSVTALSIGGPLAAIYALAQGWPPRTVRASLALYFLTYEITAFALYAWTGLIHRGTLANVAVLAPGLALGFGLGTFLATRMDQRAFRRVALTVIIGGSLVLMVREVARF
ncbi:MAG: sulfite exporter TauE/SafE family protein [Chloroflexi bacterium]|nr:sulfite exporter TauE/SafE family protein [Chloroflexota bacterium]